MTGILLVDKPEGETSAGVIRRLKRHVGRRTKIGHAGTLDPFASGLLPLCIGEATKVARFLTGEDKAYEGTIRLGVETDTLDPTGKVIGEAAVGAITAGDLASIARGLTGPGAQRPPMFSAVKQGGVPLYRLARRGEEVAREPRPVEIGQLELTQLEPTLVHLRVRCSKGTYIRVLGADVARMLGTVGHLASLRRVAVGDLRVEESTSLTELEALPEGAPLPLLGIRDALGGLPERVVGEAALAEVRRGQQAPLAELPPGEPGEFAILLGAATGVAGVIEAGPGGSWRIVRMLQSTGDPLQA